MYHMLVPGMFEGMVIMPASEDWGFDPQWVAHVAAQFSPDEKPHVIMTPQGPIAVGTWAELWGDVLVAWWDRVGLLDRPECFIPE